MSDVVELAVPVRADLLVLARLTAATLASRAEFGIEEIEDLRLVTEELCLSVTGSATGGVLHLRFLRDGHSITVECSLETEEGAGAPVGEPDELSVRIIEALVDEHGTGSDGTWPSAWIRKRGTKVAL